MATDHDQQPTEPSSHAVLSRRAALAAGLTGAGAITLAACGGASTGSGGANYGLASGATGAPTSAASSTSATSATSSSSPDSTTDESSASSASSSSQAAGTKLATLADITVGSAVSAQLDGKPIIVARPTSTTAACFSAICTHQGCTVKPNGGTLDCPCHGSTFNAETGAVEGGPAPTNLPKIAVTVSGGAVYATS